MPRAVWSLGIRILHWLTAAVLAIETAIAFGAMNRPGIAGMTWLPSHISLGVAILVLVVLRLIWRAFGTVPVRPFPAWVRITSFCMQVSLYLLLLGVIVSGWCAYGPMPLMAPPRLFGIIPMPPGPKLGGLSTRDFAQLHSALVWFFLGLVSVHILAALWHALICRDGVFNGMVGSRRSP